jgi:hypothetical protein
MSQPVAHKPTEVYYPESDGKPMAETEVHAALMVDVKLMLDQRYRDRADVHVGMDLIFYYVEGDPKQSVVPDVYVTFGMDKALRRTYRVWMEGKAPDVIFEMTSSSTRRQDLGPKKRLYERLGVKELFLVDPLGDYLDPPLQGFRLGPAGFEPIPGRPLASQVLDLELAWEREALVMVDRRTGERLETPAELARRAEREAGRAEREANRAEREADRAEREADRAEREAERRRAAEARVRELEALMRERGGGQS